MPVILSETISHDFALSGWGFEDIHPDEHQHGGRKPTETSVSEFCYKNVNLSLEELKNIKIILFPIQEPVQIAKFPEISPEISHFLTNSAVV